MSPCMEDTSHGLAAIILPVLVEAEDPLDELTLARRAKLTPMAVRSALRALERRGEATRTTDGGWRATP